MDDQWSHQKMTFVKQAGSHVKPWMLAAAAVPSALTCVLALRANNLKMVELRQAVYDADKNNGDIEKALYALRQQVYGHMNTSLTSGPNAVHPPIQLKYTYERLVQAQGAAVAGNDSENSATYTEAQQYCESAVPNGVSGSFRLTCIQDYIKQHGLKTSQAQAVPKNLYQFDFVSPTWSPDLAGWTLVLTVALVLSAAGLWLKRHVLSHLFNR